MNENTTPNSSRKPGKPTKREARASARERLAKERARRKQVQARRRKIGIGAAVVAVIAVAAGITVAVSSGGGKSAPGGPLVVPANTSGANGTVIVYGKPNAKHALDVYEDFRCPICDKLEKADGPIIQQLADSGTYKIQYHMGTFLDNNLGGTGSMDALQVAGAAVNESPAKFKAFHDVLYANQPPQETTDRFGNPSTLLDLAKKVPGLLTPTFAKDVRDRVYAPWASKVTDAFNASGVTGTPTIKLDGKQLTVFDAQGNAITPAQYTALIQQTIAGK